MNIVVNSKDGCDVYQNEKKTTYRISSITYIKLLCLKHLFSYHGYIRACKHIFDFKYKIPLYISDQLQFIPSKSIKHVDVIWINYAEIKRFIVKKQGIMLIFNDDMEKMIEMSEIAWIKQIKRLDMIKSYKVKHFHS